MWIIWSWRRRVSRWDFMIENYFWSIQYKHVDHNLIFREKNSGELFLFDKQGWWNKEGLEHELLNWEIEEYLFPTYINDSIIWLRQHLVCESANADPNEYYYDAMIYPRDQDYCICIIYVKCLTGSKGTSHLDPIHTFIQFQRSQIGFLRTGERKSKLWDTRYEKYGLIWFMSIRSQWRRWFRSNLSTLGLLNGILKTITNII